MVTMLLALTITIALEGFLSFLTTEYRMVHRTYSYGSGIYLAEAGVEEGIAMINNGNSSWAGNGWYSLGSDSYTKTITNFTSSTGGSIGQYTVNVLNSTNNNPVIICTGTVDTASSSIASAGTTNITRVVKAILGKRAIFQWGLLAENLIDLNGNNATTDSYDSSDTTSTYSDYDFSDGFGKYEASKHKDNGDVATNSGITNSVSVGNADILGHVATGPGGTATVGPNGYVGSLSTHPNGVIQPDRISSSMNVNLPLPTVPFSSGTSLGSVSSSTTIAGSAGSTPVDYVASSVSLSGSEKLKFTGYSRIWVTGNISTTGNALIELHDGAKVEIYVAGSVSIAGNGVQNDDGPPANFQLYALGSASTSITGNGEFTGVVYAPGSAVTIGGNGEVNGAVVGNTITLSGNANFHYDEALRNNGPSRGYSILAWQEL